MNMRMHKTFFLLLIMPILVIPVFPVSAEEMTDDLFDTQASQDKFKSGLKLYDQNDYMKAIQAFDEAIQINPENVDAYYFIGYSYYKMNRMEEAMAVFEQAYEIDSKYSPLPRRPQIPPP